MGALADAYAVLKSGTLWSSNGRCKGYAVSNPKEAAQVDSYVAALDSGQTVAPPTLATDTGRGLVGMLAALAATPAPAPAPAPSPTPTTAPATPVPVGPLIFSDDFNTLDLTVWDVKDNRKSGGSPTIWQKANVTVANGWLDIKAYQSGGQWYGGEINAMKSYRGPRYVEALAIVPAGQGTWAAPIWEVDYEWGAAGVELDICEQLGREPNVYHATVHNWETNESSPSYPWTAAGPLAGAAHRYGAAVYDDRVDCYLDGQKTVTIPKSALSVWKFTTTDMIAMIDLDMGGTWAGAPTIPGPVHLLVDYVNVWALA